MIGLNSKLAKIFMPSSMLKMSLIPTLGNWICIQQINIQAHDDPSILDKVHLAKNILSRMKIKPKTSLENSIRFRFATS
jgi:hypothetical protein